ncbi:MAG: hypothetical protein EPO21_06005 [Chloroflexota bacterium]|nr:MAG: hypothetical protein EPO21_06005 [Chloroflexota bacterium]
MVYRHPTVRAFEIDEAQLRQLLGERTFARAQALQRDQHVFDTIFQEATLRGSVVGTWRRIYQVAASNQAGKLAPSCSCGTPGFCQHVGAMLLQWVRDRASFATGGATDLSGMGYPMPSAQRPEESLQDELQRLLGHDTLPHLREIARRRGVSTTGRSSKIDLIQALVPVLSSGDRIDHTLASLHEDGRRVLDIAQLQGSVAPAYDFAIREGYRALGWSDENVPIAELLDLGLLMTEYRQGQGPTAYRVPRVVVARLRQLDSLARPVAAPAQPERAYGATRDTRPQLSIGELLLIVCGEIAGGRVRQQQPSATQPTRPDLARFEVDPDELGRGENPVFLARERPTMRLRPEAGLFADADLGRLSTQIGQPLEAVAFAAHLLARLGIVEGGKRWAVYEDSLLRVLDRPPGTRLALLCRAWREMNDWGEMRLLVGKSGRFQLRCYRGISTSFPQLSSDVLRARRLVASTVGRMAAGVWYDFASFFDRLRRLAPTLFSETTSTYSFGGWWLADPDEPPESLHVKKPIDWIALRSAIVAAILSGPLSWLGLVEVACEGDSLLAFRVRPEAGALLERDVLVEGRERAAPLVVGDDLTVLVPAGTPDVRVYGALTQAGELADFSTAGLRYRLSPGKVQALFEAGVTVEQLCSFLADRSGGALPEAARAKLGKWWISYGTARLYDDLTLIELADDLLLTELLAATSLRTQLIHAFSPRLIAVEPGAVEKLVTELTRLGHAPRLMEDS